MYKSFLTISGSFRKLESDSGTLCINILIRTGNVAISTCWRVHEILTENFFQTSSAHLPPAFLQASPRHRPILFSAILLFYILIFLRLEPENQPYHELYKRELRGLYTCACVSRLYVAVPIISSLVVSIGIKDLVTEWHYEYPVNTLCVHFLPLSCSSSSHGLVDCFQHTCP